MRLASKPVRSEATSEPARAPTAADMAQPSMSIDPALMPWSRAESGLAATARSLRPSRVFWSSAHRTRHSSRSTTTRPIVDFWTMAVSPSLENSSKLPDGNGDGIVWGSVPNTSWASELRPRNRPSVTITTLSGLRPVSTGRMRVRSIAAPAMKAMAIEMTMAPTTGSPVVVSFQEM
jgi:hypothetical protein